MNRFGRAAVLLAVGVVVSRLVISGGFGWFVQQRMRWPLAAAGLVVLIFGIFELVKTTKDEDSAVAPAVGWLLVLPLFVLISVAPTGLGSSAANRVAAYVPPDSDAPFLEIDTSNLPVEMTLFEFLDRAVWDENHSLEGVPVLLRGLVVNDTSVPDGFKLTRFLVSCCAADGIPLQVTVRNSPQVLTDDEWVDVVVMWKQPSQPYLQMPEPWVIEAEAVEVLVLEDPPSDPYESPY